MTPLKINFDTDRYARVLASQLALRLKRHPGVDHVQHHDGDVTVIVDYVDVRFTDTSATLTFANPERPDDPEDVSVVVALSHPDPLLAVRSIVLGLNAHLAIAA